MALSYVVNQSNSQGRLLNQIIVPYQKPELKPLPPTKPPSWITPERQDYLVKLWVKYGNQCLLGHPACPIREHYIHDYSRYVKVPELDKPQVCTDTHGNIIRDSQGNPLYRTVYKLVGDILHDKRIREVITDDGITHLFGLYDLKSETIIKEWIAEDRIQRQAEWQAEYEARHREADKQDISSGLLLYYNGQLHTDFKPISREIFYDNQPAYYLQGLGISGLTCRPFAKIRLSSSLIALHVDLNDLLRPLSKNQRHKAIRYGKIPFTLSNRIKDACWSAVKAYLNE